VTSQLLLQQSNQWQVWSGSYQWNNCSSSCVWSVLCGIAFSYWRITPQDR